MIVVILPLLNYQQFQTRILRIHVYYMFWIVSVWVNIIIHTIKFSHYCHM